jgi:MFS family permease
VVTRLGPLRTAVFRRFYAAQVLSRLGDGIVPVALTFAILGWFHSAASVGIALAARTIAQGAAFLVAGAVADRTSRLHLVIAAASVRAGTQGLLGALVITRTGSLWVIVLLQVVTGAASAWDRPAVVGLVPELVAAKDLQSANALLGLSQGLGLVVGPAAAGLLLAVANPGWALVFDAATFVVSAVLLSQVRVTTTERAPAMEWRLLSSLREGWRAVASRAWLWLGILNFGLQQFVAVGVFFVVGPVVAERSLGGSSAWATIMAAEALGGVAGGIMALRVKPRRPLFAAFAAFLGFVPPLVLLALAAPTAAIACGALVGGAGAPFADALWFTTIQKQLPADVISRVSSFDYLGSKIFQSVGFAAAGWAAARVGPAATLWTAAAVFGCTCVLMLLLILPREPERGASGRARRLDLAGGRSQGRS